MKTSVELQDPFSYMIIWLILAILILAAFVFTQVYFRKKLGDELRKAKKIKLKKISEATLEGKKRKYITELDFIEMDLRNNKIDKREAYQKMSKVIRMFVHDVTGINVQKYSLMEIKRVNIPQLTQLVREYYEPEFALSSSADTMTSLFRTRNTISSWRR